MTVSGENGTKDLALVLSGGGARAAYQVGVLQAIAETGFGVQRVIARRNVIGPLRSRLATVYPPGSGLTGRTLGNFPSLETCREACVWEVGADGEYECGLNCRPDPSNVGQQYGLSICERTER